MHTHDLSCRSVGLAFSFLFAVGNNAHGAPRDVVAGQLTAAEKEAYYGDLHLHTSYSFDACLIYEASIDPDQAYRYARGETIKYLDQQIQREGPSLDFMAVTDHSEYIGVFRTLRDPHSNFSRSQTGKRFSDRDSSVARDLWDYLFRGKALPGANEDAWTRSAWEEVIRAANRNYTPGTFTTFIAYEWTAMPDGHHLHRNVIFRGDNAPVPFTALDSTRPEDLWKHLESIREQGYEALAIPHNSNLSNGLSFDWVDSDGRPISETYAEMRAANEPLVEIAQNKGQSETHPLLSPTDEFANFEVLVKFGATHLKDNPGGSFVRDALGRGLEISGRTSGVNPFKYGFVGGSDFHNGLSSAAEDAYAGTFGASDVTSQRPNLDEFLARVAYNSNMTVSEMSKRLNTGVLQEASSGNLTGVWAEQNTRESIYAALRRKETFATSGTRLKLRIFGSWDYAIDLFGNQNWVTVAYANGVPMGSDLPTRQGGSKAPTFAVWAAKDPIGAHLDRLQIVKVWLESGRHKEKVYDVALSGKRKVDTRTGRTTAVGDTVDVRAATYTNHIGAAELFTVWRDPQFNADAPAVYYLRVIEIPTPRWTTIRAVRSGEHIPLAVSPTIQERGWSSPIWYTPQKSQLDQPDAQTGQSFNFSRDSRSSNPQR